MKKNLMEIAEEVQDMIDGGDIMSGAEEDLKKIIIEKFEDVEVTEEEADEIIEIINFRA